MSTVGAVATVVPTVAVCAFPAFNAMEAAVVAVTVTVAVWVIATALMVTDTTFAPAAVELRVPVATPLALVVLEGCVRVLPLPVADKTTVAPLIGFPFASLAVTVIVLVVPPALAVMLPGAAATVDCVALTAPAVPVAVKVTEGLPGIVAAVAFKVSGPAVGPSVQLVTAATPLDPEIAGLPPVTVPPSAAA